MRRALPWVLVGLVGLVTAAAAALGAAAAPGTPTVTPAQWVAGVLATTAQAGTAHFTYDQVTTSPNPELRGRRHGGGVVDFSRGNVQVQEIDYQVEFESGPSGPMHPVASSTTQEQISVGSVTYERFFPTGLGGQLTIRSFGFRKVPFARASRADLGLSFALGANAALAGLDGSRPVVAVRDLGTTTVDGQRSTAYLVQTAPPTVCPAARKAAQVATQGPPLLWVDGEGRLLQVRSTWRFSGLLPPAARRLPAFAQFPTGPVATTATLTFSAFGAPVHIAAPPPGAMAPGYGSSTGYASIVASHTCASR
jgi:hypothetical protein